MWSWWIGVMFFVLIIGYFVYSVLRRPADRSPEATTPKDAPLPVPPERSAVGVQAILRIPIEWREGRKETQARFVAFRPGGGLVAGIARHGVRLWDAQTGTDLTQGGRRFLTWGASNFEGLAWSADGATLYGVTCEHDRNFLLAWDATTGARVAQQEVQRASISAILPASDGATVAWLGSRALGTWEPASGTLRGTGHNSEYVALAHAHDASGRPAFLTVNCRYEIELHDPESFEVFETRPVETYLHFIGLLDHGRVAVFAYNGAVELVETGTGAITARRDGLPENVSCVCGGPGFVALGSDDGEIILCSLDDLEVLAEADVDGSVEELAATPDGLLLTMADRGTFENVCEIWDSTQLRDRWVAPPDA